MLALAAIAFTNALAAPPPALGSAAGPGTAGTDRIEVLAIGWDTGQLAFRRVSQPDGATDCGYPGLAAGASAGIGLWSLDERRELRWFDVYAPADDPSDCTSFAASRAALEGATRVLGAVGLPLDPRPAPIAIDSAGAVIDVGGRAVTVQVAIDRQREGARTRGELTVYADGVPFFRLVDPAPDGVAETPDLALDGAWVHGTRILLRATTSTGPALAGPIELAPYLSVAAR
ncbi:MAG: hypothetical protein ABMB14_00585 [Myxococcota bacterium]